MYSYGSIKFLQYMYIDSTNSQSALLNFIELFILFVDIIICTPNYETSFTVLEFIQTNSLY